MLTFCKHKILPPPTLQQPLSRSGKVSGTYFWVAVLYIVVLIIYKKMSPHVVFCGLGYVVRRCGARVHCKSVGQVQDFLQLRSHQFILLQASNVLLNGLGEGIEIPHEVLSRQIVLHGGFRKSFLALH